MKNIKKPNILIIGTPGVGKTHLCSAIIKKMPKLKWHNISEIAKENNFLNGFDSELNCPIIDEDKILDYLEPFMVKGGNIVEYHAGDFFPERFFNGVFVITCDNTILYDRLKERKYSDNKISENIECEIFQIVLDEARNSYDQNIIHILKGDTDEDLKNNVTECLEWIRSYGNET